MPERGSDLYRRGLTLGLTMAEIFILILFILLLMLLLALYAFTPGDQQSMKEQLEKTQAELTAKTKEIDQLRANTPAGIQKLVRQVASLEEELQTSREENTISKKLLAEKDQRLEQAKTDVERTKKENRSLEQSLEQVRVELYASKGIDPPCWYKVETRRKKRYEQPYFLLDVAVHDEHLRVRLRPPPPGGAVDEDNESAPTSYAEEYAKLPLDRLATTTDISIADFIKFTEPILRMGKNKQIRNYPCVFHALVWDRTSRTAKESWKRGEDAIKSSFYVLRVRNEPWENSDATH